MPINQLLPEEQGWEYFNLLPLRVEEGDVASASATGGIGQFLSNHLAVPKLLRDPINDLASLAQRPVKGQVGENIPPNELLSLTGVGMGTDSLLGTAGGLGMTRGYHGTPYKFEPVEGNPFGKFSNEAIGSGEGAQAYGYGHYVAENPKVAGEYKKKLSAGWGLNDKELAEYFTPGNVVPGYAGYDKVLKFQSDKNDWAVQVIASDKAGNPIPGERPRTHRTMPDSRNFAQVTGREPDVGSLYELAVRPDKHEFLDWDLPMHQQPEIFDKVLKAVPGADETVFRNFTGRQVYDLLVQDGKRVRPLLAGEYEPNLTSKERAAKILSTGGIPGIKYADQGSRNQFHVQLNQHATYDAEGKSKDLYGVYQGVGGKLHSGHATKEEAFDAARNAGTHNLVVFSPDDIVITGRNGERLFPVDHNPFEGEGK